MPELDDDDKLLGGFDLDAWAPPRVGASFADRVISRVAATHEAIAVEVNRLSKRRWMVGAGIAAVLAAAAAIIVWQMPGRSEPAIASGTMIAAKPLHLVLDRASVDLDVGANITWTTDGHGVKVTQHAGGAMWHVAENQHLEIHAGSLAMIEASNATLHVEAKMNLADTKILGAAAVTAATLVTLIVYEGHVKTTRDGETMTVVPGTIETYVDHKVATVKKPEPPTDPSFALVRVQAGESVAIHDPTGVVTVAVMPPENCPDNHANVVFQIPQTVAHDAHNNPVLGAGTYPYATKCEDGSLSAKGVVTITSDDGEVVVGGTPEDVVSHPRPDIELIRFETATLGIHYVIRRLNPHVLPVPPHLDATDIEIAMTGAKATFAPCALKSKVHLAFTVTTEGKAEKINATATDHQAAACVKSALSKIAFPKAHFTTNVTYALAPALVCDADALVEQGTEAEGKGDHATALGFFQGAYACKKDPHTLALTFMAACNAKQPATARSLWKMMAEDTRTHLLPICLHSHITKDMLDAP